MVKIKITVQLNNLFMRTNYDEYTVYLGYTSWLHIKNNINYLAC